MASITCLLAVSIVLGIINIALFLTSLTLGFAGVIVTRRDNPLHAMHIMMVATFLGLLVPFTFTVLTKYLVDYLVLNVSESLEQEVYASIELHKSEYFGSDLQHPPTSLSSTTTITTRRLILHDHLITGVHHHRFQATTTPVLMLMFMGQAAVMCSILSFMWSVFISNHFMEKPLPSCLPYLLVQVLGGLIPPIAVCAGVAMLAVAVHFVSSGQVDLRGAMVFINPAIVYTSGYDVTDTTDVPTSPSHLFWVISNHFYAQIKIGNIDTQPDKLFNYVDTTPSTWVITGTIVLSLLATMIHFVNSVLLESLIVEVPPKEGECDGVNCYTNWNTKLVDCTDNTTYIGKSYLHCYSFSSHSGLSLWGSISITFGVYAATVTAFKVLFAFASMLDSIFHSRAWGVLYIAVGALGIVTTIIFSYSPRLGALHLDEVKAAHLIIQSLYAVLSGVLLFLGSVQELIKAPAKEKALLLSGGTLS